MSAINPAHHPAAFPRLCGLDFLSEKTFFITLIHMNIAHHKANSDPACSRACFCLGLFSMLGNIFHKISQNPLPIFEGKGSGFEECLQDEGVVDMTALPVSKVIYCSPHVH